MNADEFYWRSSAFIGGSKIGFFLRALGGSKGVALRENRFSLRRRSLSPGGVAYYTQLASANERVVARVRAELLMVITVV